MHHPERITVEIRSRSWRRSISLSPLAWAILAAAAVIMAWSIR